MDELEDITIREHWIFNNKYVNLSIPTHRMVGYIDWFSYHVWKSNKKALIEMIKSSGNEKH